VEEEDVNVVLLSTSRVEKSNGSLASHFSVFGPQSSKKLFRGTLFKSVLEILVNSALSFFCSCGCMAFRISCPFSFKKRFVASAVFD
jgi:hypothetical protein